MNAEIDTPTAAGQSDSAPSFAILKIEPAAMEHVGAVPNGTPKTRCQELVEEFKANAKKSTQSVLGMATAVATAKKEFKKDEKSFAEFCKGIGLNAKGSTFRKLVVIGEKAARFSRVSDKLPANWTSLYQLAKLNDEQWHAVVRSKTLGPDMTADDIKAVIKKPEAGPNPEKPILSIFAEGEWSDDDQSSLEQLLKEKFGSRLKLVRPPTPTEQYFKAMSGWHKKVRKKLVSLVKQLISRTKKAKGKEWTKWLNKTYKAELQIDTDASDDVIMEVLGYIDQEHAFEQLRDEAINAIEQPDPAKWGLNAISEQQPTVEANEDDEIIKAFDVLATRPSGPDHHR